MSTENKPPFRCPHLVGTYGDHFNRLIPLIDDEAWLVGRDPKCDIILDFPDVSRRHAEIRSDPRGGWLIRDLDSANGTLVNGVPIADHHLEANDRIKIYKYEYTFVDPDFPSPFLGQGPFRYLDETLAGRLVPTTGRRDEPISLEVQTTTIGSGSFNDIVIAEETVSTNHCKIKSDDGDYVLVDLKSTNGTWVNGERVTTERLIWAGDEVGVGKVAFRFAFFRRPEEKPKKESSTSPVMLLLLFVGVVIIVFGAFLFALALAALLSDVPPFGPIPKTIVKPLWTSTARGTRPCIVTQFERADKPAVVVATADGQVSCLDGLDGSTVWTYRTISPISAIASLPTGRQASRLLVTMESGCLGLDDDGRSYFETPYGGLAGTIRGTPPAARSPAGRPLFAVATTAGRLAVLDGLTGDTIASEDFPGKSFLVQPIGGQPLGVAVDMLVTVDHDGVLRGHSMTGKRLWKLAGPFVSQEEPLCGDLDGDGSFEVVVRTRSGMDLTIVEARRGRVLHSIAVGEAISCRPALADLHQGRGLEIIVPVQSGNIAAYRYPKKQRLWRTSTLSRGAFTHAPTSFDVNRDGRADVIAVHPTGELLFLNGLDGSKLASYSLGSPAVGFVLVADINRDGRLDLVVQLKDGTVSAVTFNRPCQRGVLVWPQGLGGTRGTGSPRFTAWQDMLKE